MIKYVNEPLVLGYGIWPSCYTYIKIEPSEDLPKETILHELAHCYDFTYEDDTFLRDTDEWIQIHKADGYYASLWYNQEAYNELSESDQRGETFAIAVELYYEYPSWLQQYCPRMYEYTENLFGGE